MSVQNWLLKGGTLLSLIAVVGLAIYINEPAQSDSEQNALLQKREALLNRSRFDDAIVYGKWLHTLNPLVANTTGDIVWNKREKTGVMLFSGLPRSQKKQQYQLKIYDLERASDQPVTASTFSFNGQENYLVDIEGDEVKQPLKFTISLIEKDKAEQLLLLAQP